MTDKGNNNNNKYKRIGLFIIEEFK